MGNEMYELGMLEHALNHSITSRQFPEEMGMIPADRSEILRSVVSKYRCLCCLPAGRHEGSPDRFCQLVVLPGFLDLTELKGYEYTGSYDDQLTNEVSDVKGFHVSPKIMKRLKNVKTLTFTMDLNAPNTPITNNNNENSTFTAALLLGLAVQAQSDKIVGRWTGDDMGEPITLVFDEEGFAPSCRVQM